MDSQRFANGDSYTSTHVYAAMHTHTHIETATVKSGRWW